MSLSLDDILAKLTALPASEQKAVKQAAAKATKDFLWLPNPGPQTAAYFSPADELFYGGEAGGGKTDLLIGLSLNEHQVSRIFRKQHGDREALIDRMEEIVGTRDGYNGSDYVWRIPQNERTVRFGAMSKPDSWKRYQGDATDLKAWDELTQFTRNEFVTVNAWLRSVNPKQRTRIVGAGNPPIDATGMWVIDYWGPWLDPEHPRPAKDGELRFFTAIGDDDSVEVGKDWTGTGPQGQVIKPKSRTFIRAGLADNPDLAETGYASTLMALPAHLRDALAYGQFRAQLQDSDRQVIPAEWILLAQKRWEVRHAEIPKMQMTAIGADVAQGGRDRMVVVPLYTTIFGEPVVKQGKDVDTPGKGAAMILTVARDDPQINVDGGGGYGGGIVETLKANNFNVKACVGGSGSHAKCRDGLRSFENKRAEMVWRFREALDPERGDNIALPPGRQIVAELTAFREKAHGDARSVIKIESNDEIVARIGVSPDLAWGFLFAWAEPSEVARETRAAHVAKRRKSGTRSINRHHANVTGRPK